jgi:predicted DCC family thiol-disulfide oxidoreductase YuxK
MEVSVNTEKKVDCGVTGDAAGWVGFDALCPVCSALERRWNPLLAPRGFPFVPLQNPVFARALGLGPDEFPCEIQLLLADGRRLGGADALRFLAGRIGWLAPLAWLSGLPGIRNGVDRLYAWVAENRYCLSDVCRTPLRRRTRGHGVFFESP